MIECSLRTGIAARVATIPLYYRTMRLKMDVDRKSSKKSCSTLRDFATPANVCTCGVGNILRVELCMAARQVLINSIFSVFENPGLMHLEGFLDIFKPILFNAA